MPTPNRYYDRNFDADAVKILPGEYYVTQSLLLVTVLGSCVAACLRDTSTGISGMNHFMLPGEDAEPGNPASASARYGVFAMEILINQLIKAGARRDRLVAKVFGGGAVLDGINIAKVGERNASFVLDFLERERIPVMAKDLCGPYPRKVYFFPDNGQVKIRVMKQLHNETIMRRESEYARQLQQAPVSGDVELF
ncbi:chemoreceptor glutamine deamidase CheD [Azoarcus communis]|uniref:Probable chemoreceptor glutamine deamidase CheD n=1 Tax=Parazoarcus communis SWub3 = DSM 12120 TaxID=1121029 RepID=A0A323UPT7_9RHOO|nr:chemoreceptor glutamine deamidase CheD [Parazoarcus communis]NMG47112.1 chemoreceptor glutamine deamidase CheD [Parazoarcus communis]NMG72381.1 chemoreceptor glutamine deamidase CheD [Parazoarcus communis SWub3 = DSM 12120]PZA14504.1 chemoreceptor glutamine deamidase CheD [Azoarcus communis] [Parazoarcus communis SWub3 = DSM 12120]